MNESYDISRLSRTQNNFVLVVLPRKKGGWNIRAEMKEYRQRAPLRKIKTIKCVIVIVKKHTHTNSSRVEKGLYAAVADNAGVQSWLEFDVARVYGKYKPFRISF